MGTALGCLLPHYPICLSELEKKGGKSHRSRFVGRGVCVCKIGDWTSKLNVIIGTQVVQAIRFIYPHPNIIKR